MSKNVEMSETSLGLMMAVIAGLVWITCNLNSDEKIEKKEVIKIEKKQVAPFFKFNMGDCVKLIIDDEIKGIVKNKIIKSSHPEGDYPAYEIGVIHKTDSVKEYQQIKVHEVEIIGCNND